MGGRVSLDTRRLRNLAAAMKRDIPEEVSLAFAERTRENIAENWSGIAPPHSSPGEPPAIMTGELARSVKVEESDGFYSVTVDKEYAEYLEYGTARGLEPRPFILPALEQTQQEAEKLVNFQQVVNKYL